MMSVESIPSADVDLSDISTPAYVINLDVFRRNYEELQRAFLAIYPGVEIGYSYKTNYARPIIEMNRLLGGKPEVVSSFELELALSTGHAGSDIYFNGPLKYDWELIKIIELGARLNVDSLEELVRVSSLAEQMKMSFGVGIRVAFESSETLGGSRFGVEYPSSDFELAVELIRESPYLTLNGIHAHYAKRDVSTVKATAINLSDLCVKLLREAAVQLKYVLIGGGFSGPMDQTFASQITTESRTFQDYASACAVPMASIQMAYAGVTLPTLVLEPGTALVADAMDYLCRVRTRKARTQRSDIAVTDGSQFAMGGNATPIRPCWSVLDADTGRPLKRPRSDSQKSIDIVGYTCVESDVLVRETTQDILVGDLINFKYQGAYSIVMRPPFIRMEEMVYVLSHDTGLRLVRDKVDLSQYFDSYATSF